VVRAVAAALAVLCLSSVLLGSCKVEDVRDQATPGTPGVVRTAAPHTPAAPTLTAVVSTSVPTSSPEPAAAPAEPSPGESAYATHTVQAGDTLLGLARQYGVPMAAVQLHNRMGDSTVVRVGEVLSIPPQAGWEGASAFWVVHVVQAGETLIGIARAYDVEPSEVQSVNGLTDADLIGVGQELVLPLDGPAVARAPTSTATPLPPSTPTLSPTVGPPAASLTSTVEPPAASPTPTVPVPLPTAVPEAPPPADVADWPYETVRLINEVRAQHGLGSLGYNETLARAAQVQANDCAQRGWCSHTGSDGADIKTRILRAGYDPASWAECWAQRQSPQGAVDIWMDEVPPNDPHRRTLLTTWLSEIGVGVAQTSWGYYFIADFGRP
jgi:uncharacterized protein YkwD